MRFTPILGIPRDTLDNNWYTYEPQNPNIIRKNTPEYGDIVRYTYTDPDCQCDLDSSLVYVKYMSGRRVGPIPRYDLQPLNMRSSHSRSQTESST